MPLHGPGPFGDDAVCDNLIVKQPAKIRFDISHHLNTSQATQPENLNTSEAIQPEHVEVIHPRNEYLNISQTTQPKHLNIIPNIRPEYLNTSQVTQPKHLNIIPTIRPEYLNTSQVTQPEYLNINPGIQSWQDPNGDESQQPDRRIYMTIDELWPEYNEITNTQSSDHDESRCQHIQSKDQHVVNRKESWDGSSSSSKDSWEEDDVQPQIRLFTEFDLKRGSLFTDQGYVQMSTLQRAGLQSNIDSGKGSLDLPCSKGSREDGKVQPQIRSFTEVDLKRCSWFTDQGYAEISTLQRVGLQGIKDSGKGPWDFSPSKGSRKDDEVQPRVRSFTEFDPKRCSLFNDQGYVKMSTLQRAGIQEFNSRSSSFNSFISSTMSDESNGSYLSMSALDFNKQFTSSMPALDLGENILARTPVGVIKRSSNDFTYKSQSETNLFKETNKEDFMYSHGKIMTLDRRRKQAEVQVKDFKTRTWCFRKPISLYERLMHEVKEQFPTETALQYSETELVDKLDFNPIESRIIYHAIRGWIPNISFSTSRLWKEKFPEDFSVNDLYLYVTRQGNSRLAEYLQKYMVDGYFMRELLKDDLLLDHRLFDDNFLSSNELKNLRLHFFPKRPRCNAIIETQGRSFTTL